MSGQDVIDPLEFAERSREIHGTIRLPELGGLADCLSSTDGELDYWLRGGADRRGRPILDLEVKGRLQLVCQRCLRGFDFTVASSVHFVVLAGADAMLPPEENQDVEDYLPAESQSVRAMVEEEVLLALPMAPMHEDGTECTDIADPLREQKETPFSVLRKLKLD